MTRDQSNEAAYVNARGVAARAVVAHSGGCVVDHVEVEGAERASLMYKHQIPRINSKDDGRKRRVTGKYYRVEAEISLAGPIAARLWGNAPDDRTDKSDREHAEEMFREVDPRAWESRLRSSEERVERLLRRHQREVETLVTLLRKKRVLRSRAVAKILSPKTSRA